MRVNCNYSGVRWIYTVSEKMKVVLLVLLVLVGGHLTEGVSAPRVTPGDVETAASEPGAAVAELNLGALLGLGGNPLAASGNPAALLQSLGGGHALPQVPGTFQGKPNLQMLRDSGALGNICNNNANSDALTNLLVYQYLSGSLPPGAPNGGGSPAAHVAVAAANPQLKALLEVSRESRTATSVTTTLTTRTITMEASTKFSTSTTSYITTITSLTSSVLPIIFRGSKITTTITDRKTEILTATEFHTSSLVLTPSIIQTLNVEITLTETSTKGLNGHFTLAQVTSGATKIIEKPISTQSVNFDTEDTLDLSSLDVNRLTALLNLRNLQYDEPKPKEQRRPNNRNSDRNQRNGGRFGNTRFHARSRFSPPEKDAPEKDAPKFNVIRGFTLSDRPAAGGGGGRGGGAGGGGGGGAAANDNSGTALENTRYSKFRKKNNIQNNSLRSTDTDRESERFSASTSRRTVSRAGERRREVAQARSQPAPQINSRRTGVRTNRQTERNRRRSGRTLSSTDDDNPYIINNFRQENQKEKTNYQTTVLTMFISGVKHGEAVTTFRTITLRNLGTARQKRQIFIQPTTIKSEPITTTEIPKLPSALEPEDVVRLLKHLDKSTVRKMLHSLHEWVGYYLHQVLDETIEPSFFSAAKYKNIDTNEIPELFSSQIEEDSGSSLPGATAALVSLPNAITGEPVVVPSSSTNICPQVSIVTETVYKTMYNSNPH